MLQANCSEVIAKLPMRSKKKAIDFLRSHGFEVVDYDFFSLRYGNIPCLSNEEKNNILDSENPYTIDLEFGSDIKLRWGDYGDGLGFYIRADQHCQSQMYPTLERMEERLNVKFEGYDGGGSFEDDYNEWKKEGRPLPKFSFQKNIKDELQLIFSDPLIKKMTEDTMSVVNYVVCKDDAHKEKVEMVKAAVKTISEKRREFIIEKEKTERTSWVERNPNATYTKEELEKLIPDDNKLFEEGQEKYLKIYGVAAFLVITNKTIRRTLLGRDTLWQDKQKERIP